MEFMTTLPPALPEPAHTQWNKRQFISIYENHKGPSHALAETSDTVHFPPSNSASFTKYFRVHSNNLHKNYPQQYSTTYSYYIDHFVCMPQHTPRTSEWL